MSYFNHTIEVLFLAPSLLITPDISRPSLISWSSTVYEAWRLSLEDAIAWVGVLEDRRDESVPHIAYDCCPI
jgi:hypothetical protein